LAPAFLANLEHWAAPVAWAVLGAALAGGLYLASRSNRKAALLLRFVAGASGAWSAVCLTYVVAAPAEPFADYLRMGTLSTVAIAGFGALLYLLALVTFEPGDRQWRRSSALLVSVTLMGSTFVRAAYQPSIALGVQAPLAVVFIATVWRFRAEPLVYLAILSVAVTVVFGTRNHLAVGSPDALQWIASTAAAVSLLMVVIAALLGLKRRQEFSVKWYRQGLLIVPLVVSSLAAVTSGHAAVWEGAGWHTAWSLGAWWAVLLVSSLGLGQPDLFGFSCVGAALAAVASFAALGGGEIPGYWGRYPSVFLVIALGAAVLAALLAIGLRGPKSSGFPRALFLASVAITLGALALEPLETNARYLGVDLLMAAGVLALAHAQRAPAWVNYLVAALTTAGAAALSHLGPETPAVIWHHRFIQVTAAAAVAWLVLAVAVRELLRWAASDRAARRQTEPLTVFGMVATLVLAVYLGTQQVRAYTDFLTTGASATLPLLGPFWGLVGWLAVLLAFLISMWLVRHTARTVLFYVWGILATTYLGLFGHTQDLYNFLIYAVAAYGSAHLVVYLFEAKFMAILSRTCALYREERRASTTIFTLAFTSCFAAAVLALFRLSFPSSLVMLGVMSAVFLAWSFVWLRGEMLYPAVFMVTLFILSAWHNVVQPTAWDAGRLYVNAMVMALSALAWMVVGNQLHPIRGEIFQLAPPARHCSVVLGLIGTLFAAALAVSPTFPADLWRAERTPQDWALGLATFALLIGYFVWGRRVFERRFFSLMGGLAVLLLGLYVGIYTGIRVTTRMP